MRATFFIAAGLSILFFSAGCGNPEEKIKAAAAAENTGNFREAARMYSLLALELAPVMRLPEAHKGKVVQPSIWHGEIEKYIAWTADAAPRPDGNLRLVLDGLERSVQHFEQDNFTRGASLTPLDSVPLFAEQWNKAFNPPPPGTVDWQGLIKRAFDKNFSIVRFAAPRSYAYDVNIISRKTSQRISFSIYPESEIFVPLPAAEYAVVLMSSVEFPGQQRWVSEHSAFNFRVSDTVSLVSMDLRTRVVKRDT